MQHNVINIYMHVLNRGKVMLSGFILGLNTFVFISRISHSMHIVSKYLLNLCHTNNIDYFSESCMCSAFGDPHVLRYSQSLVSFAGQCKYTLSRFLEIGDPCMFDVQVNYYKGQKTSDGAAMVEYVLLEMYGMVIQLGPHRQVMVCNLNRNMYMINSLTCLSQSRRGQLLPFKLTEYSSDSRYL
jgi:hypothetical protein